MTTAERHASPARRVFGIETEYGITCASTNGGPAPLDADHAARELFKPLVQRHRSTNVFTPNGGRLYLDVGSHPEYATAECDRLADLLAQDRAGELLMARLVAEANTHLAEQEVPGRIHLLKNNLDAEGSGFGCHENYLVHRRGDFWKDARALVPHLVTRQILVGAGHIDVDPAGNRPTRYVFSQRADQMHDAVSAATTRVRPLINTRDEPHADAERFRRMHVIVGDSNIAQGSTLLKLGQMDLLLDYLEKGGDLSDLALAEPMRAIRDTCHDLSGQAKLELASGGMITALDLQEEHLSRISAHCEQLDLDSLQSEVLSLWARGLQALRCDDLGAVATDLDWAAKLSLLRRYQDRTGAELTDPRVARLLLAYHDIAAQDGLRSRLESAGLLRRYVAESACECAMGHAPATTRAHLRGQAVAWAQARRRDLAVDWVNLKLEDGSVPAIALRDPLVNSDVRVDALLAAMQDEPVYSDPYSP
ncbi:Pup--protein ligase [Actinomyces bovis]|uniref:Pup--protein ligase n=1 Tax=Actinomyces bovis TaxID=1658 RepID=A0ABY1VK49_9ACTO|nr:Pup--protein ligase [Actinomyces bovis]SPT52400.1 Pup--protein ligase [Actinomyces bovis]VEG54008.1 Pup--protein ligase [Actinomyces israelii]